MIGGALAAGTVILLLLGAGAGVRALVRGDDEFDPASALVLGAALCAPLASAAELFHLPARESLVAGLAIWTLLSVILHFRRRSRAPRSPRFAAGWAPFVFCSISAIVFNGFLARPMSFGDEVTLWGYKSSVFVASGRIDPGAWTLSISRGPSYPPAVPAAAALPGILLGGFEEWHCRIFNICAAAAFATSIFRLLQLRLRGFLCIFASAAIVLTPAFLRESSLFMADTIFTAAIALAARELMRNPRSLPAWTHTAAISCFKIEGFVIAGLLAVSICSVEAIHRRRPPIREIASFAIALALFAGPWFLLLASLGFHPLTGEPFGQGRASEIAGALASPLESFRRFGTVLVTFGETLADWRQFALVVPCAAAIAAVASTSPKSQGAPGARVLFVVTAAAILLGQAIPLTLAPNFAWQLDAVRIRASFHLIPALILVSIAFRALDPLPSAP